MIFLLMFWLGAQVDEYTVVMKSGRVYQCQQPYVRTSQGYVQLNLTDGRVLTFDPEFIDFEETARRNGEASSTREKPLRAPARLPISYESNGDPPARRSDASTETSKRPIMEIPVAEPIDSDDGLEAEPLENAGFEDITSFFDAVFGSGDSGSEAPGTFHTVLVLGGLVVCAVARIWFLVIAFRTGVLWGFGVFCLPFVDIAFLVKYWEESWLPFVIGVAALAISTLGVYTA